jgi:hypothetical protein
MGVGRGRGVTLGVELAVGVGVTVTVGVAVGVGVGVIGGVGVGVGHGVPCPWHQVMSTVSTRQPSSEPLLSLAIRQRSVLGIKRNGRYATVVMKPSELPLQA